MMNANSVIERANELDVVLTVSGDRIQCRPGSLVPPDFVEMLQQNKSEVIRILSKQHRYQQLYSGDGPGDPELARLVAQVQDKGCVLCWSKVLDDYVAFHRDDVDTGTIPVGFVPYSERELVQLFREGEPEFSVEALRLIHSVKKSGARVTDVSPE